MINTTTIQDYIRDPEKTVLIRQAIQDGFVQYQMQTFDQSLMQLYKEKRISLDDAVRASTNPHEFALRIKGIQASSDTTWDRFEGEESEESAEQLTTI
jgi:twitching motility protein PilT